MTRLDVCKHKQCLPFAACLYGDHAEDPFLADLLEAMTKPIDPDWRPCCSALHHWPPGARCDG